MNVAVLVPRRSDGGRRDQLWSFVKARWTRHHPDWVVSEGHHDDGPFNRSAAVNRASAAAGDWDVAVIADSDSFVSESQITDAISQAVKARRFTLAYDRYAYLSRAMSDRIMNGYDGDWWPGVEFTMQGTCSNMVVVPRRLWDQVGGFDEGFIGWGFEDIGFSLACQTFGGGLRRVHGEVWHLWHPPSVENNAKSQDWQNGLARMKRYEAAGYDLKQMRSLLREFGVSV